MPSRATKADAETAADFLKGMANPNRLMILARLTLGEASVGDLETGLGIKQPTLSQQLAGLRDAGLVEARRDVRQVFYRLSDDRAAEVLGVLRQVFGLASPTEATQAAPRRSKESSSGQGAAAFARILPFPDEKGRA